MDQENISDSTFAKEVWNLNVQIVLSTKMFGMPVKQLVFICQTRDKWRADARNVQIQNPGEVLCYEKL